MDRRLASEKCPYTTTPAIIFHHNRSCTCRLLGSVGVAAKTSWDPLAVELGFCLCISRAADQLTLDPGERTNSSWTHAMYCRPPIDGLELLPAAFRHVCFPPGRSFCDGLLCDEAPFLAGDVRSGEQRPPSLSTFSPSRSKGITLASSTPRLGTY